MGLAALVYLSLAQGLGEGALLEQEEACSGTIQTQAFQRGRKDLRIHFSTGEQYFSQGWQTGLSNETGCWGTLRNELPTRNK